ncbi:Protein of unknown function [Andreprevotia lacus DSM 23236]|jgi:hypothetical protein|uniref:DUF1615 domain-containing protein n=1 Tax=Andreprevotia lacus DSM 23236 TaxID=1121001 RepID=A0A1W1XAD2_9NEIS|nr:DUF1615 domain-containing protein [Andreprevotia lacus]SMC20807.1 Protein of unknown function [Andreprevotia lacus DSM 23236]
MPATRSHLLPFKLAPLALGALALLSAASAGMAADQPASAASSSEAVQPLPNVLNDLYPEDSEAAPVASAVESVPTPTPQPQATPVPALTAAQGKALLLKLLPARMPDRQGWADDIFDAFTALKIPYTAEYFCAANAVIEQESSWQGDPTVPGLPKIVWDKIGEKAGAKHIPLIAVQTALLKTSPNGQSYKSRIDNLRTEREMNAIFEDLANDAARLGLSMNMNNPIRTGGPMQVSVEFAEAHVRAWPYPYKLTRSVRDTVFTRRGGTYFGIAILLQYPAPYSDMVYRFADFNAGRYASRNAAFQAALAKASGQKIDLDGDLLSYVNGAPSSKPSDVEQALFSIAGPLGMSRDAIRRDLLTEKLSPFGQSELYRKVFTLAEKNGKPLPRAVLPEIRLISPKITRKLTTAWFAERVDGRYQACLARGK